MNGRSQLRRRLALGSFAASAAAVSLVLIHCLNAASVRYPPIPLNVAMRVEAGARALAQRPVGKGEYLIAFLGDSTATRYPEGRDVPFRLQQALGSLRQQRIAPLVYPFDFPAMGPFEYYCLADLVLSARPDQVVLAFNLVAPSDRMRRIYARPELAGWIGSGRMVEAARLPLHWIGISLDDLLLYTGLVHVGAADAWRWLRREHARVEEGWRALTARLGQAGPSRGPAEAEFAPGEGMFRFGAGRTLERYGRSLDGVDADHPALQVMAAAVRSFVDAGVPVLVYVVPANLEHFEKLGVLDREGLALTLTRMRAAVEGAGGVLVDLHALLPDAGFRDAGDHFTVEGPLDGPLLVARELAPLIRERALRAR